MIREGDIVQVNCNTAGITLCIRAEVLHVPTATGDSWGFKPLVAADMREFWTSESITVYKEEPGAAVVVGDGRTFKLEFHPAKENPTDGDADYLLYNQCDGYHFASAYIDGDFQGFMTWNGGVFPPDGYCAWATLPTSHTELFNLFAKRADQTA